MSADQSDDQPGVVQVTMQGYRCRCGHEWVPRASTTERPRVCPKCKSPNWDLPYRWRRVKESAEQ